MLLINGQPANGIDPQDRGFCYGHGVFETMRVAEGQVPLWPYHRARLLRGLAVLDIDVSLPVLEAELTAALAATIGAGVLKLMVTAGVGVRGYRAVGLAQPNRMLQWFPGVPGQREVSLQRCAYPLPDNPRLAGIKHLNRLDQVLAAQELATDCEGLLLDGAGRVIEALSHNLFALVDGLWQTPALDRCGVSGVMRAALMAAVFPTLALPVADVDMPLATLLRAEEVFLCNAVAGILPVTTLRTGIDAAPKVWRRGEETLKIQTCLQEIFPCFTV